MTRDQLYFVALRKLSVYQRTTRAEARELRRRRLADGSYPAPRHLEAAIPKVPLGPMLDPRMVRR